MESQVFAAFAQYGLAGLIILLLGTGAHYWTSKIWEYATNQLMPKYWQIQERRIESDHEYRIAYTAKMDLIVDTTGKLDTKVEAMSHVLERQTNEFENLRIRLTPKESKQ